MTTKFKAFIADLAQICEKHRVYISYDDYDSYGIFVSIHSSPEDCTTDSLMQDVFKDETDGSPDWRYTKA